MNQGTLQSGHTLTLLCGGADFFPALIASIDQATAEVRLETYIFHFDTTGEAVAGALERSALRGVQVYLVMDGVGTATVPPHWVARWRAAGVRYFRFAPLGRLGLLIPGRWRRLHRKLCVVDGRLGFCGGINVLDDFFEFDHGVQTVARYDFAVQVQGPLVQQMHQAMLQFWRRWELTHGHESLQFQELRRWLLAPGESTLTALPPAAPEPLAGQHWNVAAGLLLRDNVRNRTRIERAYRQAVAAARAEVIIANAYFIPGRKMRRALKMAVQRGVRVRLLVQGRYEYFMQYHAAKPAFAELLSAGVEIYEYQSGFFHAKVAVVDSRWATVGSSNLDPLSLLLAREANIEVQDTAFAQRLRESLQETMLQHCRRLDAQTLHARPWSQKAKDWVAYGLMRLSIFLTGRRY